MDNRYYKNVIAEMEPLFKEQGFVLQDDGCYKNDKRAVKIEYDGEKQSYVLSLARIDEGQIAEFVEVSSWLFDDSQTEKDAESVGIDFSETLRENIGAKKNTRITAQVELPYVSKNDDYNVTALSKKLLDYFPQFKEPYKEHVTKYGNFLYLDFFGTYIVPQITAVYNAGDKKAIKRLTDIFENAYVVGDKEAVNVLIAIISAAIIEDETAKTNLIASLGENTHFISAVESFMTFGFKNAKVRKALLKK